MRTKSFVVVFTLFLACICCAGFCDEAAPAKSEPATTTEVKATDVAAKTDEKPAEVKVSVTATDTKVKDILDSLQKQSKERFVVESTVKGDVASLSLTDVSLESALTTVCKSARVVWRKLYIAGDSKLLEQPDKLASTVRLMAGLSFPDMVLAGSSTGRVGVHFEDKTAVKTAEDEAAKTLGMTKVYLITNDAAVAAKAAEKEKSSVLDGFINSSKEQMDMFMKMTPEEREQAMMESLNLMDQIGPDYMAAAMQTVMKMDSEYLNRMQQRQMDVIFSMPEEQRRAMIKMNMKQMSNINPEQQKILMEDAKAVMEEMKNEQPNQ